MKYLLQNQNAGYIGNSPLFWKRGGGGYTQWIDEAEQFTKEKAESIVESTRSTHLFRMWTVEQIEAVSKRTVDMQDLREVKDDFFE